MKYIDLSNHKSYYLNNEFLIGSINYYLQREIRLGNLKLEIVGETDSIYSIKLTSHYGNHSLYISKYKIFITVVNRKLKCYID